MFPCTSKTLRVSELILENIWTILQLITWKFSWMRWGVMDLGITITFLWIWKRIRTWWEEKNTWVRSEVRIPGVITVSGISTIQISSPMDAYGCRYLSRSLFVLLSDGFDVWILQEWRILRFSPAQQTVRTWMLILQCLTETNKIKETLEL